MPFPDCDRHTSYPYKAVCQINTNSLYVVMLSSETKPSPAIRYFDHIRNTSFRTPNAVHCTCICAMQCNARHADYQVTSWLNNSISQWTVITWPTFKSVILSLTAKLWVRLNDTTWVCECVSVYVCVCECVSACRDIVSFIVCLPVAMASADLHFIRNILGWRNDGWSTWHVWGTEKCV